eukprot:TRINITY_DN3509_c1_g1_i1.p1 TRINITY_DN3509_c1_g1~~TRINITY_DN3509_c1_g1_i1.p1  ORF type:complete len:1010 (+),score=356.42 TRINITY_DN3509_c1_g1_i1:81-3110(+)
MDVFANLQRLSISSKVSEELDNYFGKNPDHRVLADFLIDSIEGSESFEAAKTSILEGDDEFPVELLERLYTVVKRMMPAVKQAAKTVETKEQRPAENRQEADRRDRDRDRERDRRDRDRDRDRSRRRRRASTDSRDRSRQRRERDEPRPVVPERRPPMPNREPENMSGLTFREDPAGRKRKGFESLTADEKWELAQFQRAGLYKGSDIEKNPLYSKEAGIMQQFDETDDVDYEIELNEREPAFMKGIRDKARKASPVKLARSNESALMKSAESGRKQAQERRELKDDAYRREHGGGGGGGSDTKQIESRPALGKTGEMSEWKKKAFGGVPTFGKITTASITEQRKSLPIYDLKDQLVNAVRDNQCLVVIGETGSGKTTQMTQYLVEAGFSAGGKKIGCTQPRRVAATSVAARVAEEFGCSLGDEVGYAIRFDDKTSSKTIIKYMTDGMLLRESLIDPDLKSYSVIMLDEAHERTVNTDVLFGLMKKLTQRRKDLHLIVTSATLDAEKFSTYFGSCPILTIPGRTFPVECLYANEDEPDYLDAALICAMQIHVEEPPGDILLFLTGQEEIDTAGELLHEYVKKLGPKVPELLILPSYAQLPSEMLSRIFEPAPPGGRKIVITTNIAEASITIDGVYYVIDPGLAKQKRYNPKLKMDSLDVAPISQASAKQRAGRAGRTGPGKCYRLYTEHEYLNNMLPMSVPEIQRTNLSTTVLTLKAMGIHDLLTFPFMDAPPQETLVMAMESLYALGALDDEGLLTKLGRRMAEFPLEPPLSKVLITAVDFGCAEDITTIVAMIQVENIFYRPKDKAQQADSKKAKFHQPEGDQLTLLAVYEGWKNNKFSAPWCVDNFLQGRSLKRAQDVKKQLVLILEKHKLPVKSAGRNFTCIQKALVSGFFFNAAKRDATEGYRTIADDQLVYIHPGSSLFQKNPEWVVYHSLVLTSKEYMREVMAIEPTWLPELAPNFFKLHDPSKSMSKRKKNEKLEPLYNKYEQNGEWRLSKALKEQARQRR